ncbi:MAG: uroporphyrinogen-III C-methyltransferase [Candidatus Melainabacteria bacterium]|nr:uroporphyrinogen-III C-methyltransferase [Candidatus Melainabacteria bacterium]
MLGNTQNNSIVYITGAGPGAPGLLTLKAKEIIKKADVIAYDNLVSKEILELALFENQKVKLIYVGKLGGEPGRSFTQDQVNNLLLELSKDYKIICRLKGGDPNVFGRGGEEAIFLKENNINFEIIPGVSSITAVPAYAGIPLTHREVSSSFTVLTAHEDPGDETSSIQWENFDAKKSTLVLLMGVKYLPKIIEKLINLRRAKDTPLAVIYWGTTSKQTTIITKLSTAIRDIEKHSIKAPSVIIIGEVVNYREILNWFETKTLFGKKILITRAKEQSFSFALKLIELGASPVNCPIISYQINEKEIYNKNIINNFSSFDWVFFTSQNAVKFFFEIIEKNCYDSRVLFKSQVAAVGYKTKLELEKYNIKADFIPKRFSFKDLIEELGERTSLKDKKILYPTQTEIINILPLQGMTTWPIYKPIFTNELDKEIINQIKEGIDVITLFSSNTASHFAKLAEKHNLNEYLKKSLIATIGDETSKIAKELFGRVDILAEPFTEEGLINSIEGYFSDVEQAVSL